MDWEQTKENAVPVRQGRSKAALQELADETRALDAKRRELWAEVANYQGDDPLEAWQRYIKWMQEYGVGGGKADLQKVLEACTKELLKFPRYTGDIRFLRIWIQYADCLPDPTDVFLFLKEKGIGRDFALYYEAYATYFELKGNFQSADAVYMDGVQRGAKPLERLKQKHSAFQQRMAQRIQRRIQDEQVLGPPPAEPVRSSLASLNARGTGRPHAVQQQQSIFGAAAPAPLFGGRLGQPDLPHQKPRGVQPTVDVRQDDEFADAENAIPGLPGYSSMPQVNNLRELKPYGVIRKENMQRPAAWNQAPLLPGMGAAGGGGGAAGSSGIDIFTDEEFQEGDEDPRGAPADRQALGPPGPSGGAAGSSLVHCLLQPGGAASAGTSVAAGYGPLAASLIAPSALPRAQQTSAAQPGSASTSAAPVIALGTFAGATTAPSTDRRVEAPIGANAAGQDRQGELPPSGAVEASGSGEASGQQDGGDGEELSYEELRAIAWLRRNPSFQLAADDENPAPSGAARCHRGSSGSGASTQAPRRPLGQVADAGPLAVVSTTDCEVGTRASSHAAGQRSEAGLACRRMPFGQVAPQATAGTSVNAGPLPVPLESSLGLGIRPDAGAVGEPMRRPLADAGPSRRCALAPVMGTSGSGQALAEQPVPNEAGGRQALPPTAPAAVGSLSASAARGGEDSQPTVTISTRGAFDLLNSLFSEDLPHQKGRQALAAVHPPGHSGATAPAAPAAQQQPSAQSGVPSAPHWQHAPSTAASAPQAGPLPPAPAHEPTVTLNTRLAFDALNDMFSDTLPHEEARRLARRAAGENTGAASTKPITNSDVRRLANAGRGCGGNTLGPSAGSGLCGPSATNMPGGSGGSSASSLAIHEDTFFLVPAATMAAVSQPPAGAGGGSAMGGFRGPAADGPSQAQARPSSAVAAIYEDTELLPRATACQPASGASRGAALIFEDTEFMTRPQSMAQATIRPTGGRVQADGAAALSRAAAPRAMAVGTTLHGVSGQVLSSRAGRPVAGLRDSAAVAGARVGVTSGQQHHARAPLIYEDTQYLG